MIYTLNHNIESLTIKQIILRDHPSYGGRPGYSVICHISMQTKSMPKNWWHDMTWWLQQYLPLPIHLKRPDLYYAYIFHQNCYTAAIELPERQYDIFAAVQSINQALLCCVSG